MSAIDEAIALAEYLEQNCKNMTPEEIQKANRRLALLTLQAQGEALEAERVPLGMVRPKYENR